MYSQEQINALEICYQEEIKKLLTVKANYSLAILSLKTQISEKDKKISELEKPKPNGNRSRNKGTN
jgi:hypothetical protein